MVDAILFYAFAALAVGSAIGVVAQPRPLYSAFSLVVTLCSLSAVYGLLGSPFIAVLQVVVYAGAISQLVVTLDRGTPIRCMLANDGVGSSFDRGAPVSVYLPCEALRVLSTGTDGSDEESGEPSATPARVTACRATTCI